jgi:DNA-binding FrmR family transcriptional regulator
MAWLLRIEPRCQRMPQSDFDPGELQTNLVRRLRSAAGHLRGVAGMVEGGADCGSVLRQELAVRAALREINRLMLRHHLNECLRQELTAVTLDPTAGEQWVAEVVDLYERNRRL